MQDEHCPEHLRLDLARPKNEKHVCSKGKRLHRPTEVPDNTAQLSAAITREPRRRSVEGNDTHHPCIRKARGIEVTLSGEGRRPTRVTSAESATRPASTPLTTTLSARLLLPDRYLQIRDSLKETRIPLRHRQAEDGRSGRASNSHRPGFARIEIQ